MDRLLGTYVSSSSGRIVAGISVIITSSNGNHKTSSVKIFGSIIQGIRGTTSEGHGDNGWFASMGANTIHSCKVNMT